MSAKSKAQKLKSSVLKAEEIKDDRFMIKVGQLGGKYVARAFPKPPGRSRGTLYEAKGNSSEEALEALRARMKVAEAEDVAGRREIEDSGFQVPQTKEFAAALRQVNLSKTQVEMLRAHAWSEAPGMTFRELAGAAGFRSARSASVAYGRIGAAIRDNLRLGAPSPQLSAEEAGVSVLAVSDVSPANGAAVWTMHPEFRAAVRSGL